MYAKVEDLKKGDVVLVASIKGLCEAKLLRNPTKAKTGSLKTWYGTDRWTTIPCQIREEDVVRIYTNWSGKSINYKYTFPVIANGKEYNKEKRIDFTDRKCWIIKREL